MTLIDKSLLNSNDYNFKKGKVLLLGGDGALGRELISQFKDNKIPFFKASRENFDINQSDESIFEILEREDIFLVINCIAMTGLDNCSVDRKNALLTNYFFPKKISKICELLKIELLHFSTDNVFACDTEGYIYKHNDSPNPTTWYGISKYLGELSVLHNKHRIIRLPMMFGPTNNNQLVARLMRNAAQGYDIKVANDLFSTPIYTPDVALWICNRVLDKDFSDEKVIHLAGDTLISLGSFISNLIERLNYNCTIELVPSNTFQVKDFKPQYCGLESNARHVFSLNDSLIKYSDFLLKE